MLLAHHGLHLDIRIDRRSAIGASDPAGVSDLVLEAALSTILDLEDSVAVVDAADKVQAYGNWLGIVKGTLTQLREVEGDTTGTIEEIKPHNAAYRALCPNGPPASDSGAAPAAFNA